jgi:hypothetical protein
MHIYIPSAVALRGNGELLASTPVLGLVIVTVMALAAPAGVLPLLWNNE